MRWNHPYPLSAFAGPRLPSPAGEIDPARGSYGGAVTVAGGERRGRRASLPGEERQRVDGGGDVRWARAGTGGTRKGRNGEKFSWNDFSLPNSCPAYPYLCFFSFISFPEDLYIYFIV